VSAESGNLRATLRVKTHSTDLASKTDFKFNNALGLSFSFEQVPTRHTLATSVCGCLLPQLARRKGALPLKVGFLSLFDR